MTYVMSDIHGNMRRFQSVMEQIDLQPDDMLYVLGDVIDRHPDGIAILQELMSMPNVKMLLGNHEYMMLDVVDQQKDTCNDIDFADSYYALALWYQNGGEATHAAFDALPDDQQKEIITYLRSLPLDLDIEACGVPYRLIHGGDLNYHDQQKHRYPDQMKYAVWYRRSPCEERSRDYNLETAYNDGKNIKARENMLEASYQSGIAFRQAYVGYIHAIAHNFGGMFGTPHGMANAVIMPYVLDWYGESAHKRLAELADVAGIVTTKKTDKEKAELFIEKIRAFNRNMNIPEHLEAQEKDIETIAERAMYEGNPLYPVPKIMNKQQCIELIRTIAGL